MAIDLKAVEGLATDQPSLKAAAGLVKPGKWSGVGMSDDGALIWGECAGSGANPYRVMADLRDLGNKCTCPSRKFPCKHSLALLWLHAEAIVPFPTAETPDWVGDWLARRRAPSTKAAAPAAPKDLHAARSIDPEPVEDAKADAKREAAAVKRAGDTERAILDALGALEGWVGDQLRLGLGGFVDEVTTRCRRIGARLVDGKAAALAGHIDELPARLLALPPGDQVRGATVELARLVLLARACRATPNDPELRRAVATAENRETLLADPSAPRVSGVWEVLAERVHTRRDGLVSQTTWLLNLGGSPRFAMLLDFFPASVGRRGSVFTPGEQFPAELVFYPARSPLRALLLRREAALIDGPPLDWPAIDGPLAAALTDPLLAEPWATERPVLLPPGRVGFDRAGAAWWRQRDGDLCLPLAGDADGLIAGTDLTGAAALWSGSRIDLLATRTPWGRVDHG
ncbi:SWIM zinc finger family protein [Sphingomonas sp. Leaf4]|uniref:SWIM zinc finger family protein n=1 Tax=Sphingomonas sp. Leaf4 TaxID=2876553 RepID=UPI001E30B5DD|nr:SWIM zinc finger family protein [Sphingomonas sp. Leaf4]